MFYFGRNSIEELDTCHPDLQLLMNRAIKYYDFSIVQGHREQEAQDKAYAEKKSKVKWPNGKHNQLPSLAVDVAPWPTDWHDLKRFYYLAGIIQTLANFMKIKVRWGGDWNMNNNFSDQLFVDLPHWELIVE